MAFWNRKKKTKISDNADNIINENGIENLSGSRQQKSTAAGSTESIIEETGQEKFSSVDRKDQKRLVRECCESAMENDRQISEAKKEYEKITSHLSDIQKIDRISGAERKELVDICKNIVNLVNERNRYKNRTMTITEAQMRRFEPYEEELVDEIKKMYSAESYQKAIESDISNLKKEKQLLYNEQREIRGRQNSLKSMAKVLSALIISIFVLFIVIYFYVNFLK